MIHRASIVGLLIFLCSVAPAEEFKAWMVPLEAESIFVGPEVVVSKENGDSMLTVGNAKSEKLELFLIGVRGLVAPDGVHSLSGRLRHENVEGQAYLQLMTFWATSATGEPAFGRGLATVSKARDQEGSPETFTGSSEWRSFSIPINCTRAGSTLMPGSIVLYVVLPGKGTVTLRAKDVRLLVKEAGRETNIVVPGAREIPHEDLPSTFLGENPRDEQQSVVHWWSTRQAGLVGGIAGSALGCVGALIGVVGGRGKARRLVIGLMWAMVGCGALLLAGGAAALVCSQPYHVYYPLLLLGGLMGILPLGLLPMMKRRYAQVELRKISAMDAG